MALVLLDGVDTLHLIFGFSLYKRYVSRYSNLPEFLDECTYRLESISIAFVYNYRAENLLGLSVMLVISIQSLIGTGTLESWTVKILQ